MKRLLVFLVLLLVLCGAGYFVWKWYFVKSENMDALRLIPADAVFIVQTDEPVEGWKTFSKSAMWQHIKKFRPLGEIGKTVDDLSETINDNDLIFSAFGHRSIWISAHVVRASDYDFLYVCDMEEGAKFTTIKDGLVSLFKGEGFTYTQSEVEGLPTHQFFDPKDRSTLYLAFVANQMVCSYNQDIFSRSLTQSKDENYKGDVNFDEIAGETASNGLCRIFLNHKNIPGFLDVYMTDASDLKPLFGSMKYSGAITEIGDEGLSFQGFTSIDDSVGGYIRALHRSGNSTTKAHSVLSERTAFMLSMGFQSFAKFYENLKDVMKEDEAKWKEFNHNKNTVERLLRFKLEEDLLGWIDDEVTIAQYQQDRVVGSKVHTVAAIKALSEEKALDKLDKLKRRLSLLGKFKTEKYKKHEIHYVEVRGLFRLLFGKLFAKIEKPYYTVLNGFVLFCDDPATLLQTIDDYEAGKTLEKNNEFQGFYKGFKKDNSLMTYVNMKKYFLDLKGILDPVSYESSYNNREFIVCFPQMGFQFIKDEGFFDTRLHVQFAVPDSNAMKISERRALTPEELETADSMSDADAFILQYINGSAKKETYDNGKVKFIAEMKNGQLNGRYLEYWENGNQKIRGKYRNGTKSGKWVYFTENGDIEKKERFGRTREEEDSTQTAGFKLLN